MPLHAVGSRSDQFMVVKAKSYGSLNEPFAKNKKMNEDTNQEESHEDSSLAEKDNSFLKIVVTTFVTVFLAEIGDKTQIATLLLSAQSGEPWLVFLGASLALVCSSLIGVLVGTWLSNILSPQRFEQIAGTVMLLIGIWIGTHATNSLIVSNQINHAS